MDQLSQEWFAARLGRVTASRVADVIAATKTGPSASRANYMAELICERLTGRPAERFSNAAMDWGREKEDEARTAYGEAVEQTGFVPHPTIAMTGASPDGLVGDFGLVEIKCPNTATHLDTLLTAKVPAKYVTQMMWQMACTGRAWCDFASYDPRLPEAMRLFVSRVDRDDAMIADLEAKVSAFLDELDAKVIDLRARYDAPLAEAA
jgi:putative phage-type endonuclease